ncbi:MAG: NAD(P)/FAD-dependent oxidoreductase [Streptosporangiales bacterium]
MEHCVIVGAGLAGHSTAVALRGRGFTGRITLLGAEPHAPYDRPPLSKQLLRGEVDDTTLPADPAALDLDCRFGVRATGLSDGAVVTDAGEVAYDAVVLATGAAPVRLPGDPHQRTLRTVEDARALRSSLRAGRRLAVVGAGWIGAELATAARAAGCAVTVVEAAATPLATALPAPIAELTTGWWEVAGVDLRLSTAVRAVEPDGLALEGGEHLGADDVVVAVGVRPEVGWLAGSGLDIADAVRVDAGLRAAPRVWAVGDVAAWWSERYAEHVRVEHWDNALRGPEVAAATLLGEQVTYDPVPYVWSEQFGRYVQYAGRPRAGDAQVWRGDPENEAAWSVCWVRDGRITAVLGVDRPRDAVQARRMAERGTPVDEGRLADPGVSVKQARA